MLFVYDTKTNNTKNFLKDCGLAENSVKLTKQLEVKEPFILVIRTTTRRIDGVKKNGMPSELVEKFALDNKHLLLGVASSGDKIWGEENFAMSGEYLCDILPNTQLLLKFEKRGNKIDREEFMKKVGNL